MRYKGFWRETIPEAILALGGDAHTTDIYNWIQSHIQLTPHELSESPHQGRPYFHNTVRGIADDMSKAGLLIKLNPGHYQLP